MGEGSAAEGSAQPLGAQLVLGGHRCIAQVSAVEGCWHPRPSSQEQLTLGLHSFNSLKNAFLGVVCGLERLVA